jgi:hypothetical protein
MTDDKRVVKSESDVHHLQSHVTETKGDVKSIRANRGPEVPSS